MDMGVANVVKKYFEQHFQFERKSFFTDMKFRSGSGLEIVKIASNLVPFFKKKSSVLLNFFHRG